MSPRRPRVLALSLALPLLVGGIGGARAADPTLEPALVRVGAVGHREERVATFALVNPGEAPLEILDVKPSCSCLDVRFDRAPVPAGGRREGTVSIHFGRGSGSFHKQVDILVAGRRDPLSFHIYANFHPGVRADLLEIVLDGTLGGGGPKPREVFELRTLAPGEPPPQVDGVRIERGAHLVARLIEPGPDRARIEVAIAADHPEGAVAGELIATVNGRLFVVPIRGHVYRGIRLDPALVNFNVVRTDADRRQAIELIPADGRGFALSAVRYEPRPGSPPLVPEIVRTPREDGGWSLSLALPPAEGVKGGFGGVLVVETDHPEKPRLEITVFGHIP